jgi:hypothetical protein
MTPLPADLAPSRRKEAERLRDWLATKTKVGPEGELRWLSNDRPVPLDTFKDALVDPPARQAKAAKADTDAFLADYRANQGPMSAEERFEARAAFGPGATVVDVITGRRTKL